MRRQELSGSVQRRGRFVKDRVIGLEDVGRESMDVVMAVAWYNAVARVLLPLEIELEDWYERR
jgi:hypothetical protein